MLVETYKVLEREQVDMLQTAVEDGEHQLLIEELGLTGQTKLLGQDNDFKVHPFRVITAEETFVFKTLFSESTKIEAYKDGLIPREVLEIAKEVKSLNHPDMAELYVWHPKPGVLDPVLVARQNAWRDPVYLLARWGEALIPFEELRELAIKRNTEKVVAELRNTSAKIKTILADPEALVLKCLAEGKIPNPSFAL